MLKRKDLLFMRHDSEGSLVGFSYDVIDVDRSESDPARFCFTASWSRGIQVGEWHMRVVLPRTPQADSQVYDIGYIMPRDGMPVELVAATGLKYYQFCLKEEVQAKSNMDFVLGDLLKDM